MAGPGIPLQGGHVHAEDEPDETTLLKEGDAPPGSDLQDPADEDQDQGLPAGEGEATAEGSTTAPPEVAATPTTGGESLKKFP